MEVIKVKEISLVYDRFGLVSKWMPYQWKWRRKQLILTVVYASISRFHHEGELDFLSEKNCADRNQQAILVNITRKLFFVACDPVQADETKRRNVELSLTWHFKASCIMCIYSAVSSSVLVSYFEYSDGPPFIPDCVLTMLSFRIEAREE